MGYLDQDADLTGNIVADHWYGRYPLARSYWINGALLVWLASSIVTYLFNSIVETSLSLQVASIIGLLGTPILIGLWLWGVVGIWRSADQHVDRGGVAVWAALAKFVVVLGALGLLVRIGMGLPGTIETARLAANYDPLGAPAKVEVNGAVLLIDGAIAQGTAGIVASALADHSEVTSIALNSGGGRLRDAQQIATMIRERSLNTTVEQACESACTFILLAGKTRTAAFGSRVGFHQPTFPGLLPAEQAQMIADTRAEYREAGVSDYFVNRALDARPDAMWYPTEPELFKGGVLNGFDAKRLIAENLNAEREVNARAPLVLDSVTQLISAKANGAELTYNYAVAQSADSFDLPATREQLSRMNSKEVCAQPLVPQLIAAGTIYRYVYRDPNGRTIADFKITAC